MTNRYRLALIALGLITALTGTAWLAAAAHADDPGAEAVWKHYWMAVAAANQCENRSFSGPQYDAMTHVINAKVNYQIGAGPRTHLIDEAKSDVQDRVFKYTCHDQQIGDLLALYHYELAPSFGG
jgi:hypothetical protein